MGEAHQKSLHSQPKSGQFLTALDIANIKAEAARTVISYLDGQGVSKHWTAPIENLIIQKWFRITRPRTANVDGVTYAVIDGKLFLESATGLLTPSDMTEKRLRREAERAHQLLYLFDHPTIEEDLE